MYRPVFGLATSHGRYGPTKEHSQKRFMPSRRSTGSGSVSERPLASNSPCALPSYLRASGPTKSTRARRGVQRSARHRSTSGLGGASSVFGTKTCTEFERHFQRTSDAIRVHWEGVGFAPEGRRSIARGGFRPWENNPGIKVPPRRGGASSQASLIPGSASRPWL